MNKAWSVEFSRILIMLLLAVVAGLTTGQWAIAFVVPGILYTAWTLYQISRLEKWIRSGTKTRFAPDAGGIWELIVQRVYRTQRKNKQQKQRLADMAKRFESTMAALPDAAVVLNSEDEIDWSNAMAKALLGIDYPKDRGIRIDHLIRHPQMLKLLQVKGEGDSPGLEMISPTNPGKTLMVTCTPFGGGQKLITARDISQRLALQKMRKAFIANASHELRTPLTVIAGYLEMLQQDKDIPQGLRKQIDNAQGQAQRMQKILDDLLTLSKLEEKSHVDEAGEQLPVADLITKLVSDFSKTRARDTHQIETQLDNSLQLRAVESDFYSLCQNLLSNAVKYSPEGTAIVVRWYRDASGNAVLAVEDQGEGIAPQHLSRLTERFYRVNVSRSRHVGGTGLGLSIVKHILENHGGYLHIESEPGRGSTFHACFPRARVI